MVQKMLDEDWGDFGHNLVDLLIKQISNGY